MLRCGMYSPLTSSVTWKALDKHFHPSVYIDKVSYFRDSVSRFFLTNFPVIYFDATLLLHIHLLSQILRYLHYVFYLQL
jgi:hypothetical protein